MLKKNKKFTLLLSGLSGALLASSAAGVALASCSTTSSSSSSDVQYSYVIDWNNEDAVKRLIVDDNGLVYSDNAMTTVIAVSPKVKLTTVKIPSRVKSILGYSKVMYKDSSGNLYDQVPSGQNASAYTKVYQSYGAFQGMESLETVALESGSQLQSIGGAAFSGCTTLKNISGLSNSLNYIGNSAFKNCSSLQAIDISNVVKVDDYAFYNCANLSSVDLSNALSIGNFAFQNCFSLSSLGSLGKVSTIGQYAFASSTKKGSSISLKLSSVKVVSGWAFYGAQGISDVDFSNNTLLTTISDNAFMYSSATTVDFSGCSSLTTMTERVFEGCTSLTDVYLPSNDITSLTNIGYNVFMNCSSLSTVGVKGTSAKSFVATSKLVTLGANFLANTPITTVNLSSFTPNNTSTTPFGSVASLAYIPNLSSVTLPDTLTTLNAGLFYGSGIGSSGGFSLTLPSTITNIEYSASLGIADANGTTSNATPVTRTNVTPFTNSGVTSVDMSKIAGYQTSNANAIPDYLFNGASKLESVILKPGTTGIGQYAFRNTTSLNLVSYPASSDTTPTADVTNGFTAPAELTSIGDGAFFGAFSATANATVDLSAMNFTTTPVAFSGSNAVTLKLPTTTQVIAANSFDRMTKLATVNFNELVNLTTIYKSNFTNTQLTSIDFSSSAKLKNFEDDKNSSTNSATGQLFTGLPTTCVVSLPTTLGTFSNVFIGTDNNPVNFSYPNGLPSSLYTVTSGVLAISTVSQQQLDNLSSVDFSTNDTILSTGPNTFFGRSKLTSVTLPAKGISAQSVTAGLFSTTATITANTSNTATPAQYVKASVPFGNNTALTGLNYSNFTTVQNASTDTTSAALFKTTNSTTWAEVAKIMNSLSYQATATGTAAASYSTKNMSAWTVSNSATSAMNADTTATWADEKAASGNTAATPASVTFDNSYNTTNDANSASISISASDSTKTIIHNGVTWVYSNNGSVITLTAKNVNMYKLKDASNNFIVYFNETSVTQDSNTYYVPGSQSVSVTLTIATKASSN